MLGAKRSRGSSLTMRDYLCSLLLVRGLASPTSHEDERRGDDVFSCPLWSINILTTLIATHSFRLATVLIYAADGYRMAVLENRCECLYFRDPRSFVYTSSHFSQKTHNLRVPSHF